MLDTARHHTLFEMLGNFSFLEAILKKIAISCLQEFVTVNLAFTWKIMGCSSWNDDEAFNIWTKH